MSLFAFFMPGAMEIIIGLVGLGVVGVIITLLTVLVLKKPR